MHLASSKKKRKPIEDEDTTSLAENVTIHKKADKMVINCLAVNQFVDEAEAANVDGSTQRLSKAILDYECNGVWVSTSAVISLCTMAQCTSNEQVFEYLYTLINQHACACHRNGCQCAGIICITDVENASDHRIAGIVQNALSPPRSTI